MNVEAVKELKSELLSTSYEYRELVREHKHCEDLIDKLLSLSHPTKEEQLETQLLKRKKLKLKDQIESILSTHNMEAVLEH